MTTADLQWVAGFLEGEGSFYTNPKSATFIVSAGQTQEWPLERLVSLVGGRIYRQTVQGPNRKPCWQWQLSGVSGAGLAMTLYALMSPRRKEQIHARLALWKSHRPGRLRAA